MSKSLLDLTTKPSDRVNRETLNEYNKILRNPDLLGRLFRLFVFKHTRKHLWGDLLADYIEANEDNGSSWANDIRTNLSRTLFTGKTVSWRKFLEGLIVLSPAFNSIELCVFSSLNNGEKTVLRIRKSTLEWDKVVVTPIPTGGKLVPDDYYRNPLEPLPLKVVRNAIAPIADASELRKIIRYNIRDSVVSSKIGSTVNSLYISALKPTMTWNRMMAIVFALGATQMMVSIRAINDDKRYDSIVKINR